MKKRALLAVIALVALAGIAFAESGQPVTKLVFIDYAPGYGPAPIEPEGHGVVSSQHFRFLLTGFKWKTVEPIVVDPTNVFGLSEAFIYNAVTASVTEWEKYGGNIFGAVSIDYGAFFDDTAPDGVNTITFGPLPFGVLGLANVWGVYPTSEMYDRHPKFREIFEFDIVISKSLLFPLGDGAIDPLVWDY